MKAILAAPKVVLLVRSDPAGDGAFGAPRKGKPDGHRGVDYIVGKGDKILSPCYGTVSKLGYCYNGSQRWRYVQITDAKGLHHRIFYVDPMCHVGKKVMVDDVIGIALDISTRYPGQRMKDHVHYEVKKGQDYLDPNEV